MSVLGLLAALGGALGMIWTLVVMTASWAVAWWAILEPLFPAGAESSSQISPGTRSG